MIVRPGSRSVNSSPPRNIQGSPVPPTGPASSIQPTREDARIEAFRDLLSAHDRRNWKAFRVAHKVLRAMGYSVHIVGLDGGKAVQS